MDDNTPNVDLSDAPDVSLIDTPLNAPLADVEQGNAADDKANDAAAPDEDTKTDDTKSDDADASAATVDQDKLADQQQNGQAELSKEDRDQAARNAWQQRQRDRQQIAEQIDQDYAPKTADQLVAEGTDPATAQIEALRQEMTFNNERNRVSELNAGMRVEAVEVMKDFPVFDPSSPQFDPDFTKDVEESYKDAARLQTNEDGSLILNADKPLYDHYQRMARIYNRGTSKGTVQGQEQMADMIARTENPGGSSSVNGPAPGSLEEMEERLANVPIT